MNRSTRIPTILAGLLISMNLFPEPAAAQTLPQRSEYRVIRQVEAFGPGTEIKLKLRSGKNLRGAIGTVQEWEFEIVTGKNKPPTRIAYSDLRLLEVRRVVFPDPASRRDRVRRAITELGTSEYIKVRLVSGDKLTGWINNPEDGEFLLVPNQQTQGEFISYDDVTDLWPLNAPRGRSGMHPLKKLAIGYAIIMGLIFAGGRSPGGLP